MPMQWNFVAAVLIVIFGFFFVTVSSRITGLIGNSSNPISGMTIATLIMTCSIFVAVGWVGDPYAPIALGVGAVVCIAASIARRDLAGPEDRLPRRRHAHPPAGRPGHWRPVGLVRHRHDDPVPAPDHGDRLAVAARRRRPP